MEKGEKSRNSKINAKSQGNFRRDHHLSKLYADIGTHSEFGSEPDFPPHQCNSLLDLYSFRPVSLYLDVSSWESRLSSNQSESTSSKASEYFCFQCIGEVSPLNYCSWLFIRRAAQLISILASRCDDEIEIIPCASLWAVEFLICFSHE